MQHPSQKREELSGRSLKETVENISELISQQADGFLKNILASIHEADIAKIMGYLSPEERAYLFRLLDAKRASQVMVGMDPASRESLIKRLKESRLSEVIDEMDSDDATDVVTELPDELAERVLRAIDRQDSEEVTELLEYEKDTAGGIMAKEFVSVNQNASAEEAINEIRRKAEEVGELYNVYVVDDNGLLVGVLSLKKLLLANPGKKVAEIMNPDVISVDVDMDQEEVARVVRRYDLVSVPVVDRKGRLVGRITVDDIVDVLEEEASEDISTMAGITDEEVLETSSFRASRFRLPWLLFAFAGELITGFVISQFESSLKNILSLVFFVPIIMAMGGNAGTQSAVIVVRGLATGEIGLVGTRRRLLKEFRIALLNGFFCSSLIFVVVSLWLKNPKIGLVIGLAMMLVMVNAVVVGATIPFLLRRLRIDPAVATGPFITTSNDVIGLLVYLGMATIFLKWLV